MKMLLAFFFRMFPSIPLYSSGCIKFTKILQFLSVFACLMFTLNAEKNVQKLLKVCDVHKIRK